MSAALLGVSPAAALTGFSLGAFDDYGLLVNNGVHNGDINTAPVDANIGIGNITGSVNLHNEVVNGEVDLSGGLSSVSGGNITGTQPASRGGPAPASVNPFVPAVQKAISAALALSQTYGAEAALGDVVTINGSSTIQASNGFLDSTGVDVFTATGFSIGNHHTLTINGTANQFVALDITGSGNDKLDGALTLTGGLTPDHVLINFTGSGGHLQGAANGSVLEGTFLAPNLTIQLNTLQLDGRLFGGASGTDFHYVSNALISQPANIATPEPAAWAMMLAGFGVVGGALRRRRAASASAA